MSVAQPTGDDVARVALSLVGVPFAMRGRSRNGVDCLGLLYLVCEILNIPLPQFADYDPRWPDAVVLVTRCREHLDETDPCETPAVGSIVLIPLNPGVCHRPRHIAIVAPRGRAVHADFRGRGVSIASASWVRDRVVASFRLRGVAY